MTNEEIFKKQNPQDGSLPKWADEAMNAARTDERERMIKEAGFPDELLIPFPDNQLANGNEIKIWMDGCKFGMVEMREKAAPAISNLKDELARSVQHNIGLQLKVADQRIEFEKLAEREHEKSERFAEWCYTRYFLVLPGEDEWVSDLHPGIHTTAELRAIFDEEEGGEE